MSMYLYLFNLYNKCLNLIGIRAQVAILGIGMIIWFWNVFQDGENKARSQD